MRVDKVQRLRPEAPLDHHGVQLPAGLAQQVDLLQGLKERGRWSDSRLVMSLVNGKKGVTLTARAYKFLSLNGITICRFHFKKTKTGYQANNRRYKRLNDLALQAWNLAIYEQVSSYGMLFVVEHSHLGQIEDLLSEKSKITNACLFHHLPPKKFEATLAMERKNKINSFFCYSLVTKASKSKYEISVQGLPWVYCTPNR